MKIIFLLTKFVIKSVVKRYFDQKDGASAKKMKKFLKHDTLNDKTQKIL